MVGMIQIVTWLLCVYLVFKALEIFQIALVVQPDSPRRALAVVIGVTALLSALAAAWFFYNTINQQAEGIGQISEGSQTEWSLPDVEISPPE